jgi:hypothetical protein
MQLKFDRLRKFSEQPRISHFDPFSLEWLNHLKQENFKVFMDQSDYFVLHRLRKIQQDTILKQPMLEIIILIRNTHIPFNHPEITKAVNLLEDDYRKRKIHITNYSIFPIKFGHHFDKELMDKIDEVTFEKNGNHHVTVLNCYYLAHKNMIYFLHSKKYTPSLYYKYAADLIYQLML